VLDADGLNAVAGAPAALTRSASPGIVMTPHTGECSRLLALPAGVIDQDRVSSVRRLAKKYGATAVLKGAPTMTALRDGRTYVNTTGNPGMATAGAGDVLSGVIAALMGQQLPAGDAALAGVFLHGRAGDLAADQLGVAGVMAADILGCVPAALRQTQAAT
jgi:NAD(P)H-hydrate epimerase